MDVKSVLVGAGTTAAVALGLLWVLSGEGSEAGTVPQNGLTTEHTAADDQGTGSPPGARTPLSGPDSPDQEQPTEPGPIPISELPKELRDEVEKCLRNTRGLLLEQDPPLKLPDNLGISIEDARRLIQSYHDSIRVEMQAQSIWSDVLDPISDAIGEAGGYVRYDPEQEPFIGDVEARVRSELNLDPADYFGHGWDGSSYYYIVRRGQYPDFDAVTDYLNSIEAMARVEARQWAMAFTPLPPDKD